MESRDNKMVNPKIKNPPLIEVVFELRWELAQEKTDVTIKIDPFYEGCVEKFCDIYKDTYPRYEKIKYASIPDELPCYISLYSLQQNNKDWPTIQLGKGIISLHDAGDSYKWENFKENLSEMLRNLFDSYPLIGKKVKIDSFGLIYLNALSFDFDNEDIFKFLKKNMKINVNIKDKFFGKKVVLSPLHLDVHSAFFSERPEGILEINFYRGNIKDKEEDSLMWETGIIFYNIDKEKIPIKKIMNWTNEAHRLISGSFLKVSKEGDLERRFIR